MTELPEAASACSCSGRRRDGPEPKRPSLGLSCSGMTGLGLGHDRSSRLASGGKREKGAQARGDVRPSLPGG